MLIQIIILVVVTEAITELLVKSGIFSPLRKFFFDRKNKRFFNFLNELFDCGYCMSVWIGSFNVVAFYFLNESNLYRIFILSILLHRLSNLLHFIVDRIDRSKIYR